MTIDYVPTLAHLRQTVFVRYITRPHRSFRLCSLRRSIGALLYSGYFINLTSNHNLIFPPHPAILSPLLHRIIKTQNLPTSGQEVTSSRLIKVTVYSKTEHLSPAPNSPQFSHQRTKTLISRASEDSQDEQTARSIHH